MLHVHMHVYAHLQVYAHLHVYAQLATVCMYMPSAASAIIT